MKKLALIFLLIFAVSLTQAFAQADKKKGAKSMKGTITSISKINKGTFSINKAEAQACLTANDPVVFVVGDGKKAKVYFILEADGSSACKKLAGYAGNKKISVFGKAKASNGINYIVEEMMESED